MHCDLCNKTISSSEVVSIPLKEMQKSVREGFNPFKTPGINMSLATGLTGIFGISSEYTFQDWRQRLMNDTTDWGLCPACAKSFRRATTQVSMPQAPQEQLSIRPTRARWDRPYINCAECGAKFPIEDSKCPSCNAQVVDICNKCGNPLTDKEGLKGGYCPSCGTYNPKQEKAEFSAVKKSVERDYSDLLKSVLESGGTFIDFEKQVASDADTAEKLFWLGAASLVAASRERNPAYIDESIIFFLRGHWKLTPNTKIPMPSSSELT